MATACCTAEWIYARGSIEFLRAEITSDVLLDTQPVEFSLNGTDWIPANWLGVADYTRTAEVLIDFGDYYKGEYHVRVRVTDSPEVPIFYVGNIEVR